MGANMSAGAELPTPIIDEVAIHELTTRAVDSIYPSAGALEEELASGRRLTAYMGIDPTAPDMHVGHESQLLKLKRLQDLGHDVILLIGDFTATIGDPTDKSAARVKLTHEQVMENALGYKEQASKILDFEGPNAARMLYNSEWLGKMSFADVLELAGQFTVQQMLERDMFRRRIAEGKPVGLHEFLYPMMQGWDSVKMGVDIEVGGSDQIFNMLVGRELSKRHLGKEKFVIAGNLLVDPTGKKIGKTEGNMITLNDTPLDMLHKIMLWGDAITPHALELCSQMPMSEIEDIKRRLDAGELSGLEGKMLLARTIVTDLHGAEAAKKAEADYSKLTTKHAAEFNIDEFTVAEVQPGDRIVDVLRNAGLATSNSEALRLLNGGAVRINGEKVDRDWTLPTSEDPVVLQVGKKKIENFRNLVVSKDNKK
jgi:tyrosyl-tRNA synthetase